MLLLRTDSRRRDSSRERHGAQLFIVVESVEEGPPSHRPQAGVASWLGRNFPWLRAGRAIFTCVAGWGAGFPMFQASGVDGMALAFSWAR